MNIKSKIRKLFLLSLALSTPVISLIGCDSQTNSSTNNLPPFFGENGKVNDIFPEPSPNEFEAMPKNDNNGKNQQPNIPADKSIDLPFSRKNMPSNDDWKMPFLKTPWLNPKASDPKVEIEDTPQRYQIPIESKDEVNQLNYKINKEVLRELVKTNQYGFSPKSLVMALSSKQNAQSETQWLRSFLNVDENSAVQWKDLTFFEFDANEDVGTLKVSFQVGKQKLSFLLDKEDGLLKTNDYYDRIKKLTFSLDVAYQSIALNATGNNPNKYLEANKFSNGLVLNDSWITWNKYSGTAWIMDRIQNDDDESSDTLSYIVGTNIHVGSYAGAFFKKIDNTDVALDPLNIQFGWKRNNSDSHSGFSNTKASNQKINEITNLKFGTNDFNGSAWNAWWNITNNRFDRIRSYYRPTASMLEQKRQMMNSLIFSPKHQTTATVAGREIKYESLGADFMAIRMNFKKTDLQAQWPELFNAYVNKTENELFVKINTSKQLNKEENFYTGGYPAYRSATKNWERRIYNEEKYSPSRSGEGEFWKASTLSKFDRPALVKPYFDHEDGLDPNAFASITKNSRIKGLPEIDAEQIQYYIDYYNEPDFRQMWGKRVNVAGDFAGNNITDPEIRRTIQYQISKRELTPELRPMLRKVYTTGKKHLTSSTQYIKGGASGSMVLNAKNEIVGIVSSVVPGYINNGWKNAIFYDFYNTYSKTDGDKIYGLDIANKLRDKNINTVIINPKNKE